MTKSAMSSAECRVSLRAGEYHVSVASGSTETSGTLDVVAPGELPQVPAELSQAAIPDALRHTAQAIWLAGQKDGQYRLEALQLVANDRGTRPAAVLIEALVSGKTIAPPK